MNANEFLTNAVRPVLHKMGMWSAAAEKLLIMTACHESGGFQYRTQQGGPAVSYFQIEPASFNDLWHRYLEGKDERRKLVDQFLPSGVDPLVALELNDEFACAVARMKYASVPEALPAVSDDEALAQYCKTHWNTEAGKATPEKYLRDFQLYAPNPLPAEWG